MPRLVPALLLILALLPAMAVARDPVPTQGYRVVKRYPHDTTAFTEGLFYLRGHLYESTGETGRSSVRKVDLETGRILQRAEVPPPYFGEGIVAWRDRLIQLTWRNHEGFVYDLATLTPRARFRYPGEGWALTSDDSHLYMSDGTAVIRKLDPDTLQQVGASRSPPAAGRWTISTSWNGSTASC
ncbi:hypothetical protein Xcc3_19690 [Xanthomonas campestris pv. campestris]|nr:hypothetical protein Xcc3_19690 [Xanthomonas campestris pv. campestris]